MRTKWPTYAFVLSALGLLVLVVRMQKKKTQYTFGRADANGISRDPSLLLPAFADKVELLFQALRSRGFDPCLHEGFRTPQRAKQLAARGTGIEKSLHSYGAAVDIVSCEKLWDDPAFFAALGAEAEKLGLTWGGRFSRVDSTHVQAVPSDEPTQNALRASNDPNSFVKKYIG